VHRDPGKVCVVSVLSSVGLAHRMRVKAPSSDHGRSVHPEAGR